MNRLALGILLSVSLPALGQSSNSWTVPGTVNVDGQNGTRFVSDIALTNPGNVATQATVSFIPAGGIPVSGTTPKLVTLSAGGTVVYRNLLDSLWSAQGSGATLVASDVPLLIRARTYNTAASGTYGVALPVFADDRLLSPGDTADSLWVTQSADGTSGYRTNVAVVFPDAGGGAAIVTVYDGAGNTLGSRTFSLDAAGFQQFGVGGFAGAVPVGRATIRATRGRAAGYAVVNDNVTGDGSLFTFEDLPEGYQDVLVNGVARAIGKNDTFFRTDGRFYNPATTDATVKVAFHANQSSNPSPATRDLVVPAGKIVDVVDVLDSLFGLPAGSSGALRFSSPSPVAIVCRTSNIDPSGAKPGTYGAQQKPIPLLAFLMSADAGAAVTGIRQSASTDAGFRTNVGFAAGGDGASYALTLETATGEIVATASASLGPFGWAQPSVKNVFAGTTIPDDATLLVKVTSGSVDVFDSSIDNASGDSVVTPVMPLQVDIPSAATIGPQGGSIRSDDGRLTLKIPAGALSTGVAVSLVTTSNGAPEGQGSGYRLSPGGLPFAIPAQLAFRYGSGDMVGGGPGALGLAFAKGGDWYVSTGGAVNPSSHTLTVPILSTTPPATARAGPAIEALDVPFDQVWAPFLARGLRPRKRAIPEKGKVGFGIFALAGSSTDSPRLEAILVGLPVDPKSLQYVWFVNWSINGRDDIGTIEPLENLAQYTAPKCLPADNPVTVTVNIHNPANTSLVGVVNHVCHATVKILPKNWRVRADFYQYETCDASTGVSRREDWKGVELDFVIDELLQLSIDPFLAPLGVKGTATLFSPCPDSGICDAVEDPLTPIVLTDVTGSYDENTDRLSFLVKIGDGTPRRYPGFTYKACPCGGDCTFHFDSYGSALSPYFGSGSSPVPENYVIDFKFEILLQSLGVSTRATITGRPCQ